MKLSDIRAALAELDLTPSKTLGQNFLHDQNLARWIVAQLDAGPGDELIEIGPGLGALTEAALETGANLTVLEKDRRLAEFPERRFAGRERFRVVLGDALEYDVRTLWPRRPVKVFGNLPYYISTPLLFHFTSPDAPVERAVFLLQRELAERLAAGPGIERLRNPERCARTQMAYKAAQTDARQRFSCRSQRWTRRWFRSRCAERKNCLPATPGPSSKSSAPGFSQRRKQLRKMLSTLGEASALVLARWPEITKNLGVSETARAEELSLSQWIALANVFNPVEPSAAQNANTERFDVVDAHDRVVGTETRAVVHANGLWHRAVHILRLQWQRRAFPPKTLSVEGQASRQMGFQRGGASGQRRGLRFRRPP